MKVTEELWKTFYKKERNKKKKQKQEAYTLRKKIK